MLGVGSSRVAQHAGGTDRGHAAASQVVDDFCQRAVVPATTASTATVSGAKDSSIDVSVCPAWASPCSARRRTRPRLGLVAELRDGRGQRRHVAAVAVDEHDPRSPPAGAAAVFDEECTQDLVADGDGSREALVLAAGAVLNGGRDHRGPAVEPRGTSRNLDCHAGVGVQRQVGPVLLGGAERHQYEASRSAISADVCAPNCACVIRPSLAHTPPVYSFSDNTGVRHRAIDRYGMLVILRLRIGRSQAPRHTPVEAPQMTTNDSGRPGPLSLDPSHRIRRDRPRPHAAMLLADLGADVIRVQRPGDLPKEGRNADVLLRGRRVVEANLKNPADRETILALVAKADVIIEGFRPGVMERLGFGPDDLEAVNPRLVYGRMTGWGQDGPRAEQAGQRHELHLADRHAPRDRPRRREAHAPAEPRR